MNEPTKPATGETMTKAAYRGGRRGRRCVSTRLGALQGVGRQLAPGSCALGTFGAGDRSPHGRWAADSVFNRAIAGEFDLVLALYHDQGHIAIKVHNFEESVAATLGIPFIRTSVDHGTAFDIAGQGIADPTSLVAAVRAAATLAEGKLA